MPGAYKDTTSLLVAISSGNKEAKRELFSILYKELHALAHAAMRRERAGHILQTTDLVHESYLRLVRGNKVGWQDRSHFFRVAARAMRRVLVDEARKWNTKKRGGGVAPVSLDGLGDPNQGQRMLLSESALDKMEALDKALSKLEAQKGNERRCKVLELHFFAGLTHEGTAEVLGVSEGTVRRDWNFVKVWLYQKMRGVEENDG